MFRYGHDDAPSRSDLLRDDAFFTLRSKLPCGEYDCVAASAFFEDFAWEPIDRHSFEPYMYTDVFIDRDWDVEVERDGRYVHVVSTDNVSEVVSDRDYFPPGTRVRVFRRAYLLDDLQHLVRLRVDVDEFTVG